MFVVTYYDTAPHQGCGFEPHRCSAFDSAKDLQSWLGENRDKELVQLWHLSTNFGTGDLTDSVIKCILEAPVGVKTYVKEPAEEFRRFSREAMEFEVRKVSKFL